MRDEWLPAFAAIVGLAVPTESEAMQLLDLTVAVSTATDRLTAHAAVDRRGSGFDIGDAIRPAEMIKAWDDGDE